MQHLSLQRCNRRRSEGCRPTAPIGNRTASEHILKRDFVQAKGTLLVLRGHMTLSWIQKDADISILVYCKMLDMPKQGILTVFA